MSSTTSYILWFVDLFQITHHAAHATATLLELTVAFAALSLRALNAINHTCGQADKTTLDVLKARDEGMRASFKDLTDAKGFGQKTRLFAKIIWQAATLAPRDKYTRYAKSLLVLALLLLLIISFIHTSSSDLVYFWFSFALCVFSAYIAYQADSTKILAELTQQNEAGGAAEVTAVFKKKHPRIDPTEE